MCGGTADTGARACVRRPTRRTSRARTGGPTSAAMGARRRTRPTCWAPQRTSSPCAPSRPRPTAEGGLPGPVHLTSDGAPRERPSAQLDGLQRHLGRVLGVELRSTWLAGYPLGSDVAGRTRARKDLGHWIWSFVCCEASIRAEPSRGCGLGVRWSQRNKQSGQRCSPYPSTIT